jgi:hypothetical protein
LVVRNSLIEASPRFSWSARRCSSAGVVRLPDHPVLLRELQLLKKRASRSGRYDVGHPRNGHDDHINSVAGALLRANRPSFVVTFTYLNELRKLPRTRRFSPLKLQSWGMTLNASNGANAPCSEFA